MSNTISITELNMDYVIHDNYSINSLETESYIEILKKINKLPFSKANTYYSDDVWDFSKLTTINVSKRKMKIFFNSANGVFKDDIKNYVLIKMIENKIKVQSIRKNSEVLCKFFNFTYKNHCYNVKDITATLISNFLEHEKPSPRRLRALKTSIKDFYTCYGANFEDLFTNEIEKVLNLGDYRAFKAIIEKSKTPDIPKDYFDKFVSTLIKLIDTEKESVDYKAVAAIYLILSQTGLRIGEILGLEVSSLHTINIFNGEESNYLTYKTWKRENGNNTFSIERIYINKLAKKGYSILLTLHKKKREELKQSYLYMGFSHMKNESQFPVDCDAFNRIQKKFYCYIDKYFPTINLTEDAYPELQRTKVAKIKSVTCINPDAETLTYPQNHQFRVHVCTELYNKGVPLKYIQKFMGHLSSEMQGYYVRPTKAKPQENMKFTLKTLEKIVSGDTKLLGASSGLSYKIKQFIKENHYNVETDLETICENLAKKIPVRQKTGGVCIKSSMLRECSIDAKTNELYCAYGVCPNIFHFYYMVDVSYRQTKELTKSIKINKNRGHIRQAQKELNMLNTILDKKLVPELDELKNMIIKKGIQSILQEYPNLQEIIENIDTTYQEVEQWKSMKL
ncbi:site-specific integrase [Vallitalea maricola]|uniref:Tyrosine-type recombinase/integrase n=1 Tax=Vallitalea maricola TaxID=3074433 RepID=A0ACB5URW3_9FIRM|nr:tyrosine-type recombinase/integrase [Vallitalea sp. AN17-2]